MFAVLRTRLPRLGRWSRLALVGCCLLLALYSAANARTASTASRTAAVPTRPVVVAARDLPVGRLLAAADVRIVRWPSVLTSEGLAGRPAQVVGRRLATPLRAREPVASSRLLGRDLTTGLAAGLVAAAVPVDDPHVADLVHPGDRVDVLGTGRQLDSADPPGGLAAAESADASPVAERLLVLSVLRGDESSAAEVIVAADHRSAVRLTRAAAAESLAVVAEPP